MDLLILIRALIRHKWIIIFVPLVTVMAAFVFTRNFKKMYRSEAQLATGFTQSEQLKLNEENFNVYEIETKFNNLVETMVSPKVIALLSYRLILHDLHEQKNIPFRKTQNKEDIAEIITIIPIDSAIATFQRKYDQMELLSSFEEKEKLLNDLLTIYGYNFKEIRRDLAVGRKNRTDFLFVAFQSENSQLSAFVVNTLTEEFLRYYRSLRSQQSEESVEMLAGIVSKKRQELNEKSERLRLFKSSNQVLNANDEASSTLTRIGEIETQKEAEQREIRSSTLALQTLNEEIRKLDEGVSSANLNNEIVRLQNRIRVLNERYINTNDKNVLDTLNFLRNALQDKIRESGSSTSTISASEKEIRKTELLSRKRDLENKVLISRQTITSLDSIARVLRSTVGLYASKDASINALEREVQLASQEYTAAQEKYNASLSRSSGFSNSLRQVLVGQPALEPEPSKRLIITGLAGITSLVLCIIGIVFMEYIDLSLKTPSNFTRQVGAKIIGVLTALKVKEHPASFFQENAKKKDMAIFTEMLRKARFEMDAAHKKVLLFTSTKNGEGKTFAIHALAFILGQSRKKVILLDTNFLNNTLTTTFQAKGHIESLFEKNPPLVSQLISPTGIPNVDIIGCKGGFYSPSEVIAPNAMMALMEKLTQEYDYILMEGANLNSTSDSKELEQYAEQVICITSMKSVIRQNDKDSFAYLSGLGEKFAGALLNEVLPENVDQ